MQLWDLWQEQTLLLEGRKSTRQIDEKCEPHRAIFVMWSNRGMACVYLTTVRHKAMLD